MKGRKFIALVIGILILLTLSSFAETKKLERIGLYTFAQVRGKIPTQEVMKTLVERYAGDIKYGFDLAGYGDLYLPFIDLMKTATFQEKTLPIGDKMIWMLFRVRGKVKIVQDIEWGGKAPLEIFSFTVRKDYKNYEFIMPRPCGNISLRRIEEVIPEASCALVVTPAKANVNDPITVDMSGSKNAKSMEVDVFNPQGVKVTTKSLTPDSAKWQTGFDKPGEYVFKARVFDLEGKISAKTCEAKTYINFPPICKLWTSCLPCKDYVGRPVTFDASGSSDPDGEVVKVSFEITDSTGASVDKFEDSEKPFSWEKIFPKPGAYAVTVLVTDDFRAISEPCKIDFEVTQKRSFFLVDGGPLFAKGSNGPYFSGRLGFLYKIVPDKLDFIISGGGALALKGEPWKSFFSASLLLNAHAGPAFFGAGIGFSTKVKEGKDSDAELIANVGFDVFNKYTSMGSVFFEGRGAIGEGRSFSKNHKLALGFRLLF